MSQTRDTHGGFMPPIPCDADAARCPICEDAQGWYPTADLSPPDPSTGMRKATVRTNGDGHCLACGYERDMTAERLNETIASLEFLAAWFDHFGNYTRARDAERLANGLREYAREIVGDA